MCVQEKEVVDYQQQFSLSDMEQEVVKYREEKQRLGVRAGQLQKELTQVSQHSTARGAVEELKKQKRAKEESYQLE